MFMKKTVIFNIFLVLGVLLLLTSCADNSAFTPNGNNNSGENDNTGGDGNGGDGTGGDGDGNGGDGNGGDGDGTGGDGDGTGGDGNGGDGNGGDGNGGDGTGGGGDGNGGNGDGDGTGGDGNGGDGDGGNGGDGNINPIFKPFDNNLYFGRTHLNIDEKKAYDLAVKTMINDYSEQLSIYIADGYEVEGRVKIDLAKNGITNIKNKDQLYKIVSFIVNDEPRLFHISGSVTRSTGTEDASVPYLKDSNGNIKEFYIRIGMRYDKYATYVDEMNTIEIRVKLVLDALGDTSKMSKPQIVRKAYEEYLAIVSYGMKSSAGDIRGSFLKPADEYYKLYKVVCEGYARSMLYLLQRLGFKAIYIEGAAFTTEKILHAWNKVELNGKWYNLDPTWDDSMDSFSPNSFKDEFLKSDSDFSAKHPEPQKDQYGRVIGYLSHGVQMPASANKSLTPSEYQ